MAEALLTSAVAGLYERECWRKSGLLCPSIQPLLCGSAQIFTQLLVVVEKFYSLV